MLAGLAASLVACGGGGDSAQIPANTAPVANAGSAQSVLVGTAVTLDGSRSTDADFDALSYAWRIVSKPNGSSATPAQPGDVKPGFIADLPGDYVFELVVSDGQLSSAAATVTITAAVGNAVPVAEAGPAQSVATASTVALDGSASSDANGDALTYRWAFDSMPAGSTAVLSSSTAMSPTFTPDLDGVYVLQLIVNDGQADGTPDTVAITVSAPPTADAGPDVFGPLPGNPSLLVGTASAPAPGNSTPLTYLWSLVSDTADSYTGSRNRAWLEVHLSHAGTSVWQLEVCQGSLCSTDTASVTIP